MKFSIPESTKNWATQNKIPLKYWDEIMSTNSQAKNELFNEQHILYLAAHQTGGRGRGTNTWTDAKESSPDFLLSSWCFRLNKTPQPITSPLVGMALFRACTRVWPQLKWSIKAPNDLYLGDKKVAGLLIENVQMNEDVRVVIGLGMNIFSHPGIERSGSISDVHPNLSEQEWQSFLGAWEQELQNSKTNWPQTVMDKSQCAELCAILNKWPLLQEEIEQVFPDGSIETPSYTYSWSGL